MIKIILFLFLLFIGGQSLANSSNIVRVGERQLVGDPHTLFSLGKLSMSGYEITLNRWERSQGINAVMETLTAQLPDDTLAWSDGERMRLLWTTPDQSHFLVVSPLNDHHVSFFLSSMRLSVQRESEGLSTYHELKKSLAESTLNAQLLMDASDKSNEENVISLLYVSSLSINTLVKKIRNILKKNYWSITEMPQTQGYFQHAYSIEALRPGSFLRLDLVDVGQSFLYVSLSGG